MECKCGGAIVGLCNCRPGQPGIQSSNRNSERVALTPEQRLHDAFVEGMTEGMTTDDLLWKCAEIARVDMIAHPPEEIQKLIDALKFYADHNSWTIAKEGTCSAMIGGGDHTEVSPRKFIAGEVARQALKAFDQSRTK